MSKVNLSAESSKSNPEEMDKALLKLINLKKSINDPTMALEFYKSLKNVQLNFDFKNSYVEDDQIKNSFYFIEQLREYYLNLHLHYFEGDKAVRSFDEIVPEKE